MLLLLFFHLFFIHALFIILGKESGTCIDFRMAQLAPPPSSDPPNPYKARLIAFYTVRCPAKLSIVDDALFAYRGREEEMFETLRAKYGPEPDMPPRVAEDLPVDAESDARGQEAVRVQLLQLYEQQDAGKVSMAATKIPEKEQLDSGSAGVGAGSSASPTSLRKKDFRSVLLKHYETNDPERVPKVGRALRTFDGREEELMQYIHEKQALEEGSGSLASSAAAGGGGKPTFAAVVNAVSQRNFDYTKYLTLRGVPIPTPLEADDFAADVRFARAIALVAYFYVPARHDVADSGIEDLALPKRPEPIDIRAFAYFKGVRRLAASESEARERVCATEAAEFEKNKDVLRVMISIAQLLSGHVDSLRASILQAEESEWRA